MKYLRLFISICAGSIFLYPLYLVLINSFKQEESIRLFPSSLPLSPTLDNYIHIFSNPNTIVYEGLKNSLIITILSGILVLIMSSMLAFSLSRFPERVSNIGYSLLLFGLILPTPIILIPVFTVLKSIGLNNSYTGLIIFLAAYYLPFGTFVFRGFLKNIPNDIIDAAVVDGAGMLVIYWKIIFPILKPASASVIIITGTWVWNDFLNPLILLGPLEGTTITVGLYRSVGQYSVNFGDLYSLMIVASLLVIIFYLFLQKYFVSGLLAGTVKG